ncbi:HYC_CC_PP family protein [Psychroflexus aurantiacus]|nr:hypothetical protein [Psychroflexus aurantiacus]
MISKIVSITLALLVLFSTLSFTVGAHYCGNILVDKAILAQAETCDMHQQMPSEEKSECCDDEFELIKGQDELQLSKAEFDLNIPLELVAFSFIHFLSPETYTTSIKDFPVYTSPQYSLDFQVLHQVFLI